MPINHIMAAAHGEWRERQLKLGRCDDKELLNSARLHLTLGMLSLPTADDLNQAKALLQSLSQEIYDALDTRSLVVSFSGFGDVCRRVASSNAGRVLRPAL